MNALIRNELIDLYNSFDNTWNYYEMGYIVSLFSRISKMNKDDEELDALYKIVTLKLEQQSYDFIKYAHIRRKRIAAFMAKYQKYFDSKITRYNVTPANGNLLSLEKENISYILESFLQSMDNNLLQFYHQMVNEGRIIYGDDNAITFTSLYNSKSIIFIEKLENIKDIMILIHELGHGYYDYITNSRISDRENPLYEIKDEIPAKVLEYKFIEFLQKNGVYEQSLILEEMLNELYEKTYQKRYDFDNLKYVIANYIAQCVRNLNFDINKYYKHIHKADIQNLVNEVSNKRKRGRVLR